MKKDLFVLCNSYPFSTGEFFLDDEIFVLSHYFNDIWVLTNANEGSTKRQTPDNVKILNYNKTTFTQKLFFRFKAFFFIPLWKDFLKSHKVFQTETFSLKTFKSLWASYQDATAVKKTVLQYVNKNKISIDKTIFYAYWHDNKALALAMLKNQHSIKAIARAHGWDMDYKRHPHPYLPFKNYIASSLNYNISISSFGKKMLEKVTKTSCHDKIIVSRLGKNNERQALHEKKEKNKFLICSCSSLIPLKRVDLIIELINKLQIDFNVHWVHFGDGNLKSEIELKAKKLNLSFELKGNVPNQQILDFYSENYIDLFINASNFEGVPVSIMEAQSAGIPVLATNVGGTSEIVNNENGFLVAKDFDIKETAKLITQYFELSEDKKMQKRTLSYQNWKENYNAEKNYTAFAELLQSL